MIGGNELYYEAFFHSNSHISNILRACDGGIDSDSHRSSDINGGSNQSCSNNGISQAYTTSGLRLDFSPFQWPALE